MSFLNLFKFELKKLFKQKLAHTGVIIAVVLSISHFFLNYVNRPADTYSGFNIILDNLQIHTVVLFTFPVIAVLMAVWSSSREFSTGTIRTVLTKPVKRENIIFSKVLAIFCYLCVVSYAIMGLSFLFGLRWGYGEGVPSFILHLALMYFEYILGSMVLVAFTFVVASFKTDVVVTSLLSLGFHRLFLILEFFPQIQKFTYSYHISNSIQLLMARSLDFGQFYQSLAVILIYILAFLLLATLLWEKRDITT